MPINNAARRWGHKYEAGEARCLACARKHGVRIVLTCDFDTDD